MGVVRENCGPLSASNLVHSSCEPGLELVGSGTYGRGGWQRQHPKQLRLRDFHTARRTALLSPHVVVFFPCSQLNSSAHGAPVWREELRHTDPTPTRTQMSPTTTCLTVPPFESNMCWLGRRNTCVHSATTFEVSPQPSYVLTRTPGRSSVVGSLQTYRRCGGVPDKGVQKIMAAEGVGALMIFWGPVLTRIHDSSGYHRCARPQSFTMRPSWLVAGAALSLLSSPAANAFHANAKGGLPRGAKGTATRGGQSLAAASGFDLGDWLKQAFNPPTAAAMEKISRWVRGLRRTPMV